MKTITRIVSAAAICLAALLGTSCVKEMKDQQMPEFITGITVTSDDIDFSEFQTPDTKVSYSSSLKFSFTIGDRLGIFPIGGEQAAFPLSQLEADGSAKFDGGAWALRSSYSYAAYYPQNHDMYDTQDMNLLVSFRRQYQTGNNSTDGLGPDAFLFSKASKPDAKGNVTIEMKQCAGVVRLMASMPVGIDVDKVVLKDLTANLKVGGFVNLKTYSSSADQYPTITDARVGDVEVDITDLTTASGTGNLIVYLWLPPQKLNGHQMEMDVVAADGKVYTLSTTCTKDLAVMGTVGLNFGTYKNDFTAYGYSFKESVNGIFRTVDNYLSVQVGKYGRLYAGTEDNSGVFTPATYDDIEFAIVKTPDVAVAKVNIFKSSSVYYLLITPVATGKTDFTVEVTSKATGELIIRRTFTIFVPDPDDNSGCEAVDMGLSVKWAVWNVGASRSTDPGSYFAWGETSPKTTYDWSKPGDYKWGVYDSSNKSGYGMTKYTGKSEGGDGIWILQSEDDPATANWGGGWRTPVLSELNELLDKTKCEWTWDASKKGYTVRSLITGNSIFLPAAGRHDKNGLQNFGTIGSYWTSQVDSSIPSDADCLYFMSDDHYWLLNKRNYGLPVRAVKEY